MSQTLESLQKDLQALANPEKAKILSGFFKTWVWQYGEWDVFLGIIVPEQRKLVKQYYDKLDLEDIDELLESKYHEYRLVWLLILVAQFEKANISSLRGTKQSSPNGIIQKRIFDFYLSKTSRINNWDLVDLSADRIIWAYLRETCQSIDILIQLAHSKNLWEQRIAILSTFAFIKKWIPEPTLEIAEILLHHKHDLIHKAVWWMLREVGKKVSEELEEEFLQKYVTQMPRTMLRYAIERFEEGKRLRYLSVKWVK